MATWSSCPCMQFRCLLSALQSMSMKQETKAAAATAAANKDVDCRLRRFRDPHLLLQTRRGASPTSSGFVQQQPSKAPGRPAHSFLLTDLQTSIPPLSLRFGPCSRTPLMRASSCQRTISTTRYISHCPPAVAPIAIGEKMHMFTCMIKLPDRCMPCTLNDMNDK